MKKSKIIVYIVITMLLTVSLHCFADGYAETVSLDLGENYPDITALDVDNNGNVLIGTAYGGLFRYDGVSCDLIGSLEECKIQIIYSIAVAQDNSYWIGGNCPVGPALSPVYVGGISHYDGETWTHYTEDDGLAGNGIRAVAVEEKGDIWAGVYYYWWKETEFIALSHFDGATWTNYNEESGLTGNSIRDLAISSDGCLWAGTNNGISRYDGTKWDQILEMNGNPIGSVWYIEADNSGSVWFASKAGISYYCDGEFTTYPFESVSGMTELRDMVVDDSDRVWITSDKGLVYLEGSEWTLARQPDLESIEMMRKIACGKSGDIWYVSMLLNSEKYPSYNTLTRYIHELNAVNNPAPENIDITIHSNTPNPFNPETAIHFTLPYESAVGIDIFNSLGQHVTTLANTTMQPGSHSIVWDGTDSTGNPVSSGVYIARIGNRTTTACHRMMLMR